MLAGALTWILAANPDVTVNVPKDDPAWATAAIAVGAALLGSGVGAYASFRASTALEIRRRKARAQVRRKVKVYTPIRTEMVALRKALENRELFSIWGIVREEPPPVMSRPPSLYQWLRLVQDGRANTAASLTVQTLLNDVEDRVETLNGEVGRAKAVFAERGAEMLAALGESPRVVNWVDVDAERLLWGEFDELGILGTDLGDPLGRKKQEAFIEAWQKDEAVTEVTKSVLAANDALRAALEGAIVELDAAMARIADRYEHESPKD